MMARNHELTGFAATTLAASAVGIPAVGCLVLGVIGLYAADWPDIDHEGATATRSLKWIPYWRHRPWDEKTQDYKRRKDGSHVVQVRYFPSWQVHRFWCIVSAWIWERCATDLDRRDSNRKWGPAFRVHRGFTHSVWFGLIVGAAYTGALWPVQALEAFTWMFGGHEPAVMVGAAVFSGIVTHIGGDACTDFGVAGGGFAPLFKVDGRRYWHSGLWEPMRFKVNKRVETHVIAPLCSLLAAYSIAGAFLGPERVVIALWTLVSDMWA